MVGVVPPPTPPLCAVNGAVPSAQNVTEKEAPPPAADVSEPPAPPVTVAVTVQPPKGALHNAPAAVPSATLSPVPPGSTGAGEALAVGEVLGVGDDVGETVFVGVGVGVEEGLPPAVSVAVGLAVLEAVGVSVPDTVGEGVRGMQAVRITPPAAPLVAEPPT